MGKLKMSHNLNDVELEEYLEKALKGVQRYKEPNREFPDRIANEIKERNIQTFDKVTKNMLKEIKEVIDKEKK